MKEPNLTLSFVVPNKSEQQTMDIIASIEEDVKKNYDEPEFSVSTTKTSTSNQCYSQKFTNSLIQLLNETKYGSVNKNGKNTNILNVLQIATNNNKLSFFVQYGYYGNYSDVYDKDNIDITNDKYTLTYDSSDNNLSYGYYQSIGVGINSKYNTNTDSDFYKMCQNSFKESTNLTPINSADINYSIIGDLYRINPSISALGLGVDVQNPGMSSEVVYTKSIPVFTSSLLAIFQGMKKLNPGANSESHKLTAEARQAYYNYISQSNFPGVEYKFINLICSVWCQ